MTPEQRLEWDRVSARLEAAGHRKVSIDEIEALIKSVYEADTGLEWKGKAGK